MSTALRIAYGTFGRVALLDMDRSLVRHAHPHCHVLIKAEGADTAFEVAGRMVALTDTQAVLVNAWEPHAYVHDPLRARTTILALYIEPKWLKTIRPNWAASGGPGFFEQPAVAIHAGHAGNLWSPLYRDTWVEEAAAVLGRFGLAASAAQPASSLPEGARKLLDVALSFIQQPKLLLMDEPTSGVSASDKFGVMGTVMPALSDRGVTTIFVEHDMEIVQRYDQRALAFASGRIIADGPVAEVLTHPDVRRSVLGED